MLIRVQLFCDSILSFLASLSLFLVVYKFITSRIVNPEKQTKSVSAQNQRRLTFARLGNIYCYSRCLFNSLHFLFFILFFGPKYISILKKKIFYNKIQDFVATKIDIRVSICHYKEN